MIRIGKNLNKKTITILDHWVNYQERFILNKKIWLPDEIWTCDKFAFQIAKKKFLNQKVKLIPNFYIQRIRKKYLLFKKRKKYVNNKSILYLGSPISKNSISNFNNKNYFGYTEKDSIDFFFKKIKKGIYKNYSVRFRPHPSEKPKDYKWIIEKYGSENSISISNNFELYKDIFESNLVVGCNSMALVIAAIACNKKSINAIPFKNIKNNLPYKKISLIR
jgi:hypothetical protein